MNEIDRASTRPPEGCEVTVLMECELNDPAWNSNAPGYFSRMGFSELAASAASFGQAFGGYVDGNSDDDYDDDGNGHEEGNGDPFPSIFNW